MYKLLWNSRTVLLGTATMLGGAILMLSGKIVEGATALSTGIAIIRGRARLNSHIDSRLKKVSDSE